MKLFYLAVAGILLFAVYANAGILSVMKEAAGAAASSGSLWIGLATVALIYLLKVIPNSKIQAVVGKFAYGIGVTATLGLSKYKWTAPFWKSIIEPYAIDIIDNTIGTFTKKLIEGLRSDNPVEP